MPRGSVAPRGSCVTELLSTWLGACRGSDVIVAHDAISLFALQIAGVLDVPLWRLKVLSLMILTTLMMMMMMMMGRRTIVVNQIAIECCSNRCHRHRHHRRGSTDCTESLRRACVLVCVTVESWQDSDGCIQCRWSTRVLEDWVHESSQFGITTTVADPGATDVRCCGLTFCLSLHFPQRLGIRLWYGPVVSARHAVNGDLCAVSCAALQTGHGDVSCRSNCVSGRRLGYHSGPWRCRRIDGRAQWLSLGSQSWLRLVVLGLVHSGITTRHHCALGAHRWCPDPTTLPIGSL